MNVFLIPFKDFIFASSLLDNFSNMESCLLNLILGGVISSTDGIDIDEAKKESCIGDSFLILYNGRPVLLQVVEKIENSDDGDIDLYLQTYRCFEKHYFDRKTVVYKDSSIREYINGEFLSGFDDEFVKRLKVTEICTDDYVTMDRCWLMSFNELGIDVRVDGGKVKEKFGQTYSLYAGETGEILRTRTLEYISSVNFKYNWTLVRDVCRKNDFSNGVYCTLFPIVRMIKDDYKIMTTYNDTKVGFSVCMRI